jgi:bidirectional [NiFe] hydrogenase diaphorase subunit
MSSDPKSTPASFSMVIDGRRVTARAGEVVLETARRAGVPIPTLCVHPAVEPFGACRLCMVEVTRESWGGWRGLMTSCLYPAAEGLVVETRSPRVLHVRRNILDLLLARCPESGLIQRLAAEHGVEKTSFATRENPDLCILCGLCTRVCETAATAAISTVRRGHERIVGTPFGDPPPDCIGCLACARVCPTGHIRFEELGAARRIWEREFELKRCADCGSPLPLTVDQAAFLSRRQGLEPAAFSRCETCQRRTTAVTLARIARWQGAGLVAEEVKP